MNTRSQQPDRAGTLKELLVIALPLIVSSGATAMMYVIDRVMLSWYSVEAMAAALPAGVLHWNLAAIGMGTIAYANAFISQYEGAGEHRRVGPVVWHGVYIAIVVAALILLCIPIAPWVFDQIDHDSSVRGLELRFFTVLSWGTLALLLDTALSCFFSGRGKTKVVMVVNVIGMLINVTLDYLLIFGNFGFPEMGIDGAATATVLAFTAISLMYIGVILWTARDGQYCMWSGRHFDRELFGRMIRFGLPTGMQQFLDIACWTVFVQLMGRLGTLQLSATGLLFNLNGLVFVPLLGLGTAVTVLTGRRIGDGRPKLAVRTAWLAMGVAGTYTAAFACVYLFAPHAILNPYGLQNNPELEALVIHLLKFVAAYCWFDSMVVVFSSAIRGAGDTTWALVFSVSMGVLLLVIPTYIATLQGPDGFYLAWYAVTAFITVLGLGFWARFQQGKWMTMKIIEHTAAPHDGDSIPRPHGLQDVETSPATVS